MSGASWGGSGGGVSDIKDTYVTLDAQTGNYTVINTGSTVIPVATNGGSFTVTLDETIAEIGARFRVQDVGGYCATNPAYVEDSEANALQRVDTNDGAVEYVWTGLSWQIIDKFENMWNRNPVTNEITPASPTDALVATEIRTSSGSASLDADGKLIVVSGEVGLAGALTDKSVADGTNIGANVDQNGTDDFGNVSLNGLVGATITSQSGFNFGPAAITVDGLTDGNISAADGGSAATAIAVFDLGVSKFIDSITLWYGANVTASNANYQFLVGSTDDGILFDTTLFNITTGTGGVANTAVEMLQSFTGVNKRYIKMAVNTSGWGIYFYELLLGGSYSNTDNTTDLAVATGNNTFDPSTFKIYDENDTLITGSGKINVAYEVDGGGFQNVIEADSGDYSDLANAGGTASIVKVSDGTSCGSGASNGFDGNNTTEASTDGVVDLATTHVRLIRGLTSPTAFREFQIVASDNYSTANQLKDCKIEGLLGSTWYELDVVSTSGDGSNSGNTITINAGTGNVVNITTDNSIIYDDYCLRYMNGQSGTSGIIGIAQFRAQELTVDNDQTVFQAVDPIASTTDFSLQIQAVGAIRWSRIEISTPSVTLQVTNSGVINIKDGETVTASFGNGYMKMDLPTSDPLVAGEWWSNSGVVTISAG